MQGASTSTRSNWAGCGKGGAGLVNDASPNVSYAGNSWTYQSHRGLGEFADDAHTATANGDAFTFSE